MYETPTNFIGGFPIAMSSCIFYPGFGLNEPMRLDALCQCRHPHVLEILGRSQSGRDDLSVTILRDVALGQRFVALFGGYSWDDYWDIMGYFK